jgi:hypothetical protein
MPEPEIMRLIRRVHDDLEFARIVRAEAHRRVLCHPTEVDRIRWHVDQAGLDDVLIVGSSSFVPQGTMYVIDEQAIDAGFRESMSKVRYLF